MLRAAGLRVVSSAYWLNLIICGDFELALHRTSTRRKYKQVKGQLVRFSNCIDLVQQTVCSNHETETFQIIQLIQGRSQDFSKGGHTVSK